MPAKKITRSKPRAKPRKNTSARVTMADVRAANRSYHRREGDDFNYFDRGNSRFFGPEKFYGPYRGQGGTFFVQKNKAGVNIKQAMATGQIKSRHDVEFRGVEDARDAAKKLAKG